MKRLLICLFLSATAQASEIDQLINTSQSIKTTFDLGIKTVAGMYDTAATGGVSPDMAKDAHLTYAQAEAYNQALTAMKDANYTMTAQEYFYQQSQAALDNLGTAIDNYVDASAQLITAVQVNDMASSVTTTEEATQLQTYITNNELSVSSEQVDTYNDSLDMVQTSAQIAASFIAAASDVALVDSAQTQADDLNQSFAFAEVAYFSQGSLIISLSGGDVSLDMSGYLVSASDILIAGEASSFYTTSPTGNECFFNPNECQQ